MSNAQTSHSKLFSRIGLAVSGLVVIAATSLPVASASAQALLVKFDGKDFDLKRSGNGGGNNNNGNGGDRKFQQITIGKGEREAEKSNKKQVPVIEIGKGDRNEDGAKKKASPRILIGKGDRDGDQKPKTQQIVVGKGDRNNDEGKVVKRQIIVEKKVKPKKIVQAEPVIIPSVKKKKVVLADKPAKKILIAATPEPEVEALAEETQVEVAPEQEIEAPVEEQVVTEEAPAAPVSAFKVGQVVTGGDGKSYVIVKIDDTGISAMPLTAFTQYEEPKPAYKPVYKKRKAKKRYSSYRNYAGNSCH